MKIKFNKDLEFQTAAVDSITNIFAGTENNISTFTVLGSSKGTQLSLQLTETGIGNKLILTDEELLENIKKVQIKNGLKQTSDLSNKNFTIEMETGTGKTYVYLKTIFELYTKYGFTKFIIVVPSIAIKEGVNKSLEITQEHFREIYNNIPYDYFIYDSQSLDKVRSFATADTIQIMIINIDAFRRSFVDIEKEDKANVIHRYNDKLGYAPIDLIKETNPIVIIDEPQSVDSTDKAKEAIQSLNPLFTLRYSATHKDKYNLMYKLDSIDAYEQKLVKQIEVGSVSTEDFNNTPYIKLVKTDNTKAFITATVEIDISNKGKVERKKRVVCQNDDLFEITKRDMYEGYIIKDIYCEKGNEYIDFTSRQEIIRLGEYIGGIDDIEYKRIQINKTIERHLDKELQLNPKGIKVLSLFFLDKVANYRIYDNEGNPQNGKYAQLFEEEYIKLSRSPKYHTLFNNINDINVEVKEVHNGYFSIDKKGKKEVFKDSKLNSSSKDDETAYNLIMHDKEKLLSFSSKLRFIFSHSALKEGWDNPNVFQICTLNETSSEIKKRQEIGRGMRLAVNQNGDRVYGFDVNTLTVIANESYEDFVSKLQKEIEEDEGIRFGYIEDHDFANIVVDMNGDEVLYLGQEKSDILFNYFVEKGYIDDKGKVTDKLRNDLKNNNVAIPEEYEFIKTPIIKQLKKVAGNLNIKNLDNRTSIKLNKAVYLSPRFTELWDKIKYKTTYRVNFDSEKLIEICAERIKNELIVTKGKWNYKLAKLETTKGGILVDGDPKETPHSIDSSHVPLPDIVTYLQKETTLTRKSIIALLLKSNKLDAFKKNPQKFIEGVYQIITSTMRTFIVDGIVYEKIGDHEFYAQELFANTELYGHLTQDMIESKKSPYEYVVYDSNIEMELAKEFEKQTNIKLYAKLPGWFKIDTPLGTYNPDWAVLWENDGEQKLYFVLESKGSLSVDMLRPAEEAKIKCGTKHFAAIDNTIKFKVIQNIDTLKNMAME